MYQLQSLDPKNGSNKNTLFTFIDYSKRMP